ncbi:MAG TPA: efflux RND transporter periplasmic adaptor subunit [Xanthobacteraceae bacterium]|nr:efflux RND transporter periplasmic adaptor subunit [Xanthobacteraceae bacterium]
MVLLLAGVAAGLSMAEGGPLGRRAMAQSPPAAPPAVTVSHPLERKVVEWDEYTGQFAAVEDVDVRARVSGYLTEIHFQDGQFVKKGDLLFVIDPRPFEADLQQAEANLERDKALVVRANLDLTRYSVLAKKEFAPQQQVEHARATAESAIATVKADDAAVVQAKLNLEFTHVTAPVDGRIGSHQVSIGNLIVGGSTGTLTLLTTIVSLDPIWFNFDMSESDYLGYQRAIQAGLMTSEQGGAVQAFVRLVDEKGWPHEGHMDFIDNQINRGAGTIRARAIFPNKSLFLTPGEFGRIRVPGSEPHQAILIPDAAIVTDQSRKIVMTVSADGTVVPRVVRPGPTYEGLRIVRDGLAAGDTIIINGLVRARPGAKVTPQPGKIEAEPEP